MDTLTQLLDKYIKALVNEAQYMCDQLMLEPYDLLQAYNEAVAADEREDTVWRDQILQWSYSIYVA